MSQSALIAALDPLVERMRTDVCLQREPGRHARQLRRPLTRRDLERHLNGGPWYGACPVKAGENVTRVAVLDLDSHGGEIGWEQMADTALRVAAEMTRRGLVPIAFRSSGGRGVHIYAVWESAQDCYSVREELHDVLRACGLTAGTGGLVKQQVEVYPKQDAVPPDGFGSMIILPLAGQSVPLDEMMEPLPKNTKIVWTPSAPVALRERPPRPAPTEAATAEISEVAALLARIPNDDLDYDEWRNVIFAIHSATGGSPEGLALAHEWSAKSTKHDEAFLNNRVWPYIHKDRDGGITIATLRAMARGIRPEDFDVIDDTDETDEVTTEKAARYAVVDACDFAAAVPQQWLIKNVLPKAALAVLYGASGSGKSFLALDMAAALAQGTAWRGEKTQKARVVYIAAEGAAGVRKRLRALSQRHELDLSQLPIGVIPAAPNLMKGEDVLAVVKSIRAWGGADVVIVDTLAQTMAGGDENAGRDLGAVLEHCKGIHVATGALVLLVHHSGKDESKGARGWSGLRAAADVELEVLRVDAQRVLTITKQKDGEDGMSYGFRLVPVQVGVDEDGDAITSCVVEHNDATIASARASARKLGATATTAWETLLSLQAIGTDGVPVEELIEATMLRLPEPEQGKRDRRRDIARRAVDEVIRSGRVTVFENVIVQLGED